MNEETKKTRIHVEIDSSIHYMMRVQAVKERMTIQKFVEKLIVNYMESVDERQSYLENIVQRGDEND
jgi:hypothetical protein